MSTCLFRSIGLQLSLLILSSFFSSAFASPVVIKSSDLEPIELTPHYQFFVDPEHNVTIKDILSPRNRKNIKFVSLPNGDANLGFQPDTYWFKSQVINRKYEPVERLLEFDFPLLDHLSVYIVNDKNQQILNQYNTGDLLPFDSRPFQHSNFVFPIALPAQAELTFYFRIQTQGTMTAGSTLWQPESFLEHARFSYFALALYLGLLIGLFSYNLLVFISIRDTSYLYYVLLAASLIFTVGSYSGLWFETMWSNSPRWHNLSAPISFSLIGIFASLFSRKFLQTDITAPLPDKALFFIMLAFIAIIIVTPFAPLIYIAPVLSIISFFLAVTIIIIGIVLSLEKDQTAQIYLISWVFFLLGGIIISFRNFGLIPLSPFSQYSLFIGSTLAMLSLSFALASRINKVMGESEGLIITNERLLEQEKTLKQLAHYDALTGLANRTLILAKLELLFSQCKRKGTKLAILFIDLDKFKPINDKYGHDVGDEVLITVANRLRSALRNSDSIGRLGGDEFIVVVEPSTKSFDPQNVANKVKKVLEAPFVILDDDVKLGASIGVAIYPDNGENIESLMTFADSTMYIDKAYRNNS